MQHTSYHQPYGSAPQHMGNPRPISFTPGIPRAVTPPQAVPPPAPSVDPVMSALAQMMSKLNEVSDRLDRVEGAKAQCSDASTEQRKGKRVELPSQPLANPRNVGQASSSHTHNVNEVCIDGASEEAHAISGLRSGKVLVDPHTGHKRRKDPLEEKDDRPSPTIIPEEDSKDEEAPDEESRAKPNPEVYKPLVSYPLLLSRPRVPTSDSDDTLLEAFRQVTITIPLVDVIQHIPSYTKFLKGLCTPTRKPKRIHMSETISSIMLSTLPHKRHNPRAPMISCEIGGRTFTRSLLDTGASVNILPKGVYDICPLGELQLLFIELSLADGSVKRPHGVVEDVIVKVENCYFLVNFIIVDMKSAKDFTDSPIILERPFLATAKVITNWGKGEVIFQVGDSTMKVSINKLMRHPSHESDEVGVVDIYKDTEILSCIEETMAAIEDRSFEELEDDPFPSREMAPELKPLPSTLKYDFLDHHSANPVIISSQLDQDQEKRLLTVLRARKEAIGWNFLDLKAIDPSLCTYHIFLEEDSRPSREAQRRLNPKVWDAVKDEILKWLNAGIIYPISDSPWVSPVHVVPKKAGITVMINDKGEEIQTRLPTKWRVCIDYWKLNAATKKEHFPLPFIDQILDKLSGQGFYCFLDGYSGYNQLAIHPDDQEQMTFTCPFGTYAFQLMPFGLCNAPATFQRCMMAIFSDFIGESMKVFMDDFSVFGPSFDACLEHLMQILDVCFKKRLVLSWEKSHFMLREGIVL